MDQIIDLHYTLLMMGVPLDYQSYAFRDNHAIIQQSNIPKSNLLKCYNALAFHCEERQLPWDSCDFIISPEMKIPLIS